MLTLPSVPFTPPFYRALPEPQRVTVYYRTDAAKAREFGARVEAWTQGVLAFERAEKIPALRAKLDRLERGEGHAVKLEAAKLRAELDKVEALAGEAEPLDESDRIDHLTTTLAPVVTRIRVGGDDHTWPVDDFDKARAMVASLPPVAALQILHGIDQNAYDPEAVGKS